MPENKKTTKTTTKAAEKAKASAQKEAPEFVEKLPPVAPGVRASTDAVRDKRLHAYARIVARHSPCEVKVRQGNFTEGDHATNDGRLLMYACVSDFQRATVGGIPEGENPDKYVASVVALAQEFLDGKGSRIRPVREQLGDGRFDVDEVSATTPEAKARAQKAI